MIHLGGVMPGQSAYDCIVIGGGPAGATAATLLADHGHATLVLERARFPRYHIGESLMPQTYHTLKRLGLLEQMKASDFPTKESVQFVSASGKDSEPYFFTDRDPGEWSRTWQVPRDCFDLMMLNNARARGAEVCEGASVERVLFDGDRACGVRLTIGSRSMDVRAKVVVDASGDRALLSKQLRLHEPDADLHNGSIYTYYKNAYRDEGRNAGATMIISTEGRKSWFWSIPLNNGITSVGLVGPPAVLFSGAGVKPPAVFEKAVDRCPGMRRRLEGARRIAAVRVTKDFSYSAKRIAGRGWVLIGDAFAFIDPVYSSGVFLAIKSGELAADAIHDALLADDVGERNLGRFGEELLRGMDLLRNLVYAFYDPEFSVGRFLAKHPEYRDHLVRLLIGDVFDPDVGRVFGAMGTWTKLPDPKTLAWETAQE